PRGTPDHRSGGAEPSPEQVNRVGIVPPCANAELESRMPARAAGDGDVAVRGPGPPHPAAASARPHSAATPVDRVRRIREAYVDATARSPDGAPGIREVGQGR